jgi:hypothetical protein
MVSWTKTIEEDPETGDLILDIKEACEALGWKEGDTIEWVDNKDGTWCIQKVEK